MTGLNPDDVQRAIDVGMVRRNPVMPPPGMNFSAAPKERKRTGRVEVDRTEYRLLRRIAGMAVAFYPVIEQSAVPVTRNKEFEELRVALRQYVQTRSVDQSDAETIVGLTSLLKDLS